MKVGVVYPQIELGGDPKALKKFALASEGLGFEHLLMYDHVVGASHQERDPPLYGPYDEKDPFHDPMVAFGYLAAITETIELVTGVLVLPQRQTVLVAKQAADIDRLSGERLRLGVSVGWNYVEYEALGENFRTRGRRLDEQIPYLRRLWTEELVTINGAFHQMSQGNINLRPNRLIPIWVGGNGVAAYKRAAAIGDGFIFFDDFTVENRRLGTAPIVGLESLRERVKANERDVEKFGFDYIMLAATTVQEALDSARRWQDADGTHVSVVTMGMNLGDIQAHIDFIAEFKQSFC